MTESEPSGELPAGDASTSRASGNVAREALANASARPSMGKSSGVGAGGGSGGGGWGSGGSGGLVSWM